MPHVVAAKLMALLVLSATGVECSAAEPEPTTKSSKLVENIRRQLMTENYDYMSSETEEQFPKKHKVLNEDKEDTTKQPSVDISDPLDDELEPAVNDVFLPGAAKDIDNKNDTVGDGIEHDHGIVKNDLLYYIDDERLKKDKKESKKLVNLENVGSNLSVKMSSPKVKYKVLKVKQRDPSRRSMGSSYRRFIQEEGSEGVAIINLDDEPFPEFRLPRNRRQYMHNDDNDNSLEVSPAEDLSEQMPAVTLSDEVAGRIVDDIL